MSAGKAVRCAIYTRKSSDEGLEQAFNSLDAQREACAAYILSQASEGWSALPEIYDDGGLSGGTLERPALRRLLAEVAAGRVDIIVVYKVDRLTRSLFDFAKLVETFDAAGTSFVSVTQSFNTTTSMGRLTLNMLLSFAQFEREVTAERIRDKIAASKARGMWMGGTPPLGYRPDGRTLAIVEEHAAIIRHIFGRYLDLGNVTLLKRELDQQGIALPIRERTNGNGRIGGGLFARGQLYKILSNPIYIGRIAHGATSHQGLHPAIVDNDTWEYARAKLADNVQGRRRGERAASPSLLAGKVVDAVGEPFTSSHACKPVTGAPEGRTRYRYYICRDAGQASTGLRIPARELEAAVAKRITALFDDSLALATSEWLAVAASQFGSVTARGGAIAGQLAARGHGPLRDLIEQVRVHDSRIEIDYSTGAIAALLEVERAADAPDTLTLVSDVRLTRSGMAMRLIHGSGAPVTDQPNASVIKLLLKARRWWAPLREDDIDITRLAEIERVNPAYIPRVLRLAFLSPAVVDAILAGRTRTGIDAAALVAAGGVPASWAEQAAVLLPAR